VKHAFVLSMYCLMRATEKPIEKVYDWAMRQVTKLQGDTDTNCAIVGGVIGAYAGLDNIDVDKVRKVLECRLPKRPVTHAAVDRRPDFVMPGEGCVDEMIELVEISPFRLTTAACYRRKEGLVFE